MSTGKACIGEETFDEFPDEQGILADSEELAIKEIIADRQNRFHFNARGSRLKDPLIRARS